MKSKHITFIGINFYPEDTAIGLYSTQMIRHLENLGYDIEIVTGFPYYPQWKIKDNYSRKPKYFEEKLGNIRILRYKQYVPSNPTFLKRVLHLVDFTIGSFFNLKKIKKTNLIICVVPFTSTIALGLWLKRRHKAKMWVHIQDFEFDAAAQTLISDSGRVKKGLFKWLFTMEKTLLNKADLSSTISKTMLNKLKSKTKVDTIYFPNWIDINQINPESSKTHTYLNSKNFKILYSGNVGDKQDWGLFVELVKMIQQTDKIELIVVGQGSRFEWLKGQLKNKNFVRFYEPVPYEELSDLLCAADLHILFQKQQVLDTVMPSKLLGMMASGVPSLVVGNSSSEVKEILNESQGGIYLDTYDINLVYNQILDFSNNNRKILQMGINARKYVSDNFSKENVLKNLNKIIDELV